MIIRWFIVRLVISLLAYFAIGSLYKSVVLGVSGWDMLPHSVFWLDIMQTGLDLFHNIKVRVAGGSPSAGYQHI